MIGVQRNGFHAAKHIDDGLSHIGVVDDIGMRRDENLHLLLARRISGPRAKIGAKLLMDLAVVGVLFLASPLIGPLRGLAGATHLHTEGDKGILLGDAGILIDIEGKDTQGELRLRGVVGKLGLENRSLERGLHQIGQRLEPRTEGFPLAETVVAGHEHRIATSHKAPHMTQVNFGSKAALIYRNGVSLFHNEPVGLIAENNLTAQFGKEGLPQNTEAVLQERSGNAHRRNVAVGTLAQQVEGFPAYPPIEARVTSQDSQF